MASVHTPTTPTRSLPSAPDRRISSSWAARLVPSRSLRLRESTMRSFGAACSSMPRTSRAPLVPLMQCAPNWARWSRCAGSSGSCQSRTWMRSISPGGSRRAQSTSSASGPAEGSVPRSRVDSACPTWRRFGSGSCGPIGSTKSRCRHCVMRTVATGRQLREGTASRSGALMCAGGGTATRRARHTVHEGHAVVRTVTERAAH